MDEQLKPEQLEELRLDLLALKVMLESALEISRDSAKTVELDQQVMGRLSRMDAMQQQAMAKASRGLQQQRLKLVEQALAAIENDTYGECRECGDYVSFGRLKVKPEALFCIECQADSE